MLLTTGLHVSVPVFDVEVAARIYQELFDLRVESITTDLAQLYLGPNRISLRRVKPDSESVQREADSRVRARHIGFQVSSVEHLGSILERVQAQGLHLVKDLGIREEEPCFFFVDPSGNQVEVFVDTLYGNPAQDDRVADHLR